MKIGYFLSCEEEYSPAEPVQQAKWAEEGESPFVWSVIGAVSQVCSLPITMAVTCPTVRIHPIVAQAAATSAVLTGGKFILGVGSGEALDEPFTSARSVRRRPTSPAGS